MKPGRKSREERLTIGHSGVWGSSSQDFIRLAYLLFEKSAEYAKSIDGNCSIYSLAGIPILFSALRCLLIEANAGIYCSEYNQGILDKLAKSPNDISIFIEIYEPIQKLREDIEILYEIRNEIIHPSHKPVGSPNNTPDYLNSLRERRLLQSTNKEDCDYIWLSQLQSHRLFFWAFETIESAARHILSSHNNQDLESIMVSYARYRYVNL